MEHTQCPMRLPTGNRFAVSNDLREIGLQAIHHATQFLTRKLVLSFFLLLALCKKGEWLFIFFFLCLFFFFPSLLSSFACLESNSHAVLTRNAHRGRLGISSFFFPHVTRDKMCDTLYKHGASITSREPLKTTRTFNLTIAVHLFGTVQTRERWYCNCAKHG